MIPTRFLRTSTIFRVVSPSRRSQSWVGYITSIDLKGLLHDPDEVFAHEELNLQDWVGPGHVAVGGTGGTPPVPTLDGNAFTLHRVDEAPTGLLFVSGLFALALGKLTKR
jgi:hypothetical protein